MLRLNIQGNKSDFSQIEVRVPGSNNWTYICDDVDEIALSIICKQLGYSKVTTYTK